MVNICKLYYNFFVNFNPFEKEKTDENFAVRATRARIAEVANVLALNY